jgi:hypothetical protein
LTTLVANGTTNPSAEGGGLTRRPRAIVCRSVVTAVGAPSTGNRTLQLAFLGTSLANEFLYPSGQASSWRWQVWDTVEVNQATGEIQVTVAGVTGDVGWTATIERIAAIY